MIDVFVLFISTHGGMIPIMELPTREACVIHQEQYARQYEQTVCQHLKRYNGHFRPPTYKKSQTR
jgi:hypothetical protein